MATVFLGNTSPREVPEGTQVHVNDQHVGGEQGSAQEGRSIVVVVTPDHDAEGKKLGLGKQLLEIKNAFRIHSGDTPAWVESHDEDFAKLVADEFDCEVGRPDDWDPPAIHAEEPKREAETHRDDTSFLGKVDEFLSDDKEVKEVRDES